MLTALGRQALSLSYSPILGSIPVVILDEVGKTYEFALYFYLKSVFVGYLGGGILRPYGLSETINVEGQARSGFAYIQCDLGILR